MEEMLRTLSLYDLTGYLIPGVVLVWSVIYVVNGILFRREQDHIKPGTFATVVAGYIIGHLVQAIASFLEQTLLRSQSLFWVPPNSFYASDAGFSDALSKTITQIFGGVGQNSPFILCQTYLRVHRLDAYTEIMQARYAFFRGLALALFISGCAFAIEGLLRRRQPHRSRIFVLAILLLIGTLLSYSRMTRFENYYVDGVYRTFYVAAQATTKSP